jgi:hypothetical protein
VERKDEGIVQGARARVKRHDIGSRPRRRDRSKPFSTPLQMRPKGRTKEAKMNEKEGSSQAIEDITLFGQLSDEDLAMVSGGCRKAGGDQAEIELPEYKPIIAI